MSEQPQAVRVHLVADSTRQPESSRPPRRMTVRYRTVVLTAQQTTAVVAGTEPHRRKIVALVSGSNDVYLTDSEASALAVVNAGTGGGLDTSFLLSHANPVPVPYESTEQVYAAAIAYPATLSVMIVSAEAD